MTMRLLNGAPPDDGAVEDECWRLLLSEGTAQACQLVGITRKTGYR